MPLHADIQNQVATTEQEPKMLPGNAATGSVPTRLPGLPATFSS